MVEREPDACGRGGRKVLTTQLVAAAGREPRPAWSTWREALRVVAYGPHLRRTVSVALIVGTVIFSINQLDVVLRHRATTATYVKGALTYLVPFCVSNYGILVATRIPRGSKR